MYGMTIVQMICSNSDWLGSHSTMVHAPVHGDVFAVAIIGDLVQIDNDIKLVFLVCFSTNLALL